MDFLGPGLQASLQIVKSDMFGKLLASIWVSSKVKRKIDSFSVFGAIKINAA